MTFLLMLGLNGIKVSDVNAEFAIDWLKEYCRIEYIELKNLENKDLDISLQKMQDFSVQLAYQVNRISKPFESEAVSRLLKNRIRTVFYPFLYSDLKPIISHFFKKCIEDSLILDNDQHMKQCKIFLRTLFQELEFLDISRALETDFLEIIQMNTERMIRQSDKSTIADFLNFLTVKIDPILEAIFGSNQESRSLWKQRFEFQIFRTHGLLLMEKSFDIFRDYPDSMEQLNDLKKCIERSGEMKEFFRTMKRLLQKRLLIIDAKTSDILDIYLMFRKCLIVLTPSNAYRSMVLNPIKTYLQTRTDITREILMRILDSTDPECEEVLEEEDIESLLSIFPSKANFAKEYHTILCRQLIKLTSYEAEEQIRHVEILTAKFGESLMSNAKVMMKDLADSRRVFNAYLMHDHDKIFSSLVISNLFWPKLTETTFKVPEFLEKHIKSFVKTFEETKTSRKLFWLPEHGSVELVVEVSGKELDLNVSPLQATVLMLFQDRNEWELLAIVEELGISAEQVTKAVTFWNSHQVLEICGNVIVSLDSVSNERLEELAMDIDHTEVVQSKDDKHRFQEHMETTWPMIQGMLTNLGALPTEMVHRTLQMFVSDAFQYTLESAELEQFLEHLVSIDILDVDEGSYKIK